MNKQDTSLEKIFYMIDLFYANKHLYEKIKKKEKEAGQQREEVN